MGAPFGLRLEEVLRLTRRQVQAFYFRERDEHGNLRHEKEAPLPGAGSPGDPADALRETALLRGWPTWMAERWVRSERQRAEREQAEALKGGE